MSLRIEETKIGTQTWSTFNLNVAEFANGDQILHAKTIVEWLKAGEEKQAAWCYFENDSSNGDDYGRLYNWYAVNDLRGLAPPGWHIPSTNEWNELIEFLGGTREAGHKLKANYGWEVYSRGTNEVLFWALPGGSRYADGSFGVENTHGLWWCTTQDGNSHAWSRSINNKTADVKVESYLKRCGFSVRCVKD